MSDSGGVEREEDLPPLPVRMLNQYVFCPRYFYLAWVDRERVDTDNTLIGEGVHRVVDRPQGRFDDALRKKATSVEVASPALGITARIDVVQEAPDGSGVIALDVKTGSPMPDGSAWPGDAAQAIGGAIALRDSGYECETAAVWYARTRQKVVLALTQERERWIKDLLNEMRVIAAKDQAPPPLISSPRCPTCSLVGVCLPDEHNTLRARSSSPPRRLVPETETPALST